MSCPNPSAHPVGVRHARETARSCSTVGSDSSPPSPALALAAVVGLVPSAPAQAEPAIDDVQTRVDRLYHEAEQASERYNDAKLELDELNAGPRARSRPTRPARTTRLEQPSSDQVAGLHRAPVRGREPLRGRPGRRLRRPERVPLPAVHDVGVQRPPGAAASTTTPPSSRRSTSASDATDDQLPPRSRELEKQLAEEKATIDDKLAEAKALLGKLEGRGARARCSPPRAAATPGIPPPTSRPPAAPPPPCSYAMAQVGDAYVYGAAGPSAFDCSGLTMMAWAPGRRRPAALLERPVQLRPAHRRERPAARRPGLLLQPDQPRRHVHRQRPDRARREPRRRRRRSPACYSMPYVGAVRPG